MCAQKLFITLLRHSVSNPSISKINRVNKRLLSDPISVQRASHSIPSGSKSYGLQITGEADGSGSRLI